MKTNYNQKLTYLNELPAHKEVVDSYIDSLSGLEISNFYRLSRELFEEDPFSHDEKTYKEALREVMLDREKWGRFKRTVYAVKRMKDWNIPDITGYID